MVRPTIVSVDGSGDLYGIGTPHWPGLAKLLEECGEVIQVLGKVIVAPDLDHTWTSSDGSERGSGDLTDSLHEELGDLRAALEFFCDNNPQVDNARVYDRAEEKYNTYTRWHAEGHLDSTSH